ncbi:MAG: SDR family oxidoreductase [Nitrospiraceae bacterium]|nr:SDR family oxidoreductase [Nitrospiraceae bacterium]
MKIALVTGGSGGLGREIARSLSGKGFAVVVSYRNSEAPAEALIRELKGDAVAIRADVSRYPDVREMMDGIQARFRRLDVVVNNAGVTADDLLIRQSEEDWDRVIATNLTGCFNVMRAAAPILALSGGGQIVNISSYSGIRGKAGQAAYSASKAALLGLTKTAAREFAADNIKVNAVLPGYLSTGMGTVNAGAGEQAVEESLLGRLAEPEDAAEMIAYLAVSKNITGQVFCLDSRIR